MPVKRELPPVDFKPVHFIPAGDAKELSPDQGWSLWDRIEEEQPYRVLREQQEGRQQ
jgi:hypothetical protein